MTGRLHAGSVAHRWPGQCQFVHHFEDVDLICPERALPGEPDCADHYIERVQARYRRFPETTIPGVTA